jgi:acrylyl-CoA reductase (NADPH)
LRAVVVRDQNGAFSRAIEQLDLGAVGGAGPILEVEFSSLNYKDALALTNRSPVVRAWPMVVGIDGAGRMAGSNLSTIKTGELALVTGWGLGETKWGCFADKVRVDPTWLTPLPGSLSPREAMAFGTAGLTAMLCIMALEKHGVEPEDGPVLVTGASGGVGGIAIMLLKALKYRVTAATGRVNEADYLKSLGATDVISREELSEPGRPLQRERWAAAVDTLGSVTLANACASTAYGGVVAACGLAQGMDFPSSVAPFILRGLTLAGIDSVLAPPQLRAAAWGRIADLVDKEALGRIVSEVDLEGLFDAAELLLAGRVRGRLVVRVNSPCNGRGRSSTR